jgi:hypothetical protein
LIHQLANTNKQNALYYHTSPLCPLCSLDEETIHHVLTCPAQTATSTREEQIQQLCNNLLAIHTPEKVIQAVLHGFTQWIHPTRNPPQAPTAGSLLGPDILLTTAYYEQFHNLGWYQCCLGRISTKWQQAVAAYYKKERKTLDATYRSSLFIAALWNYTKALWNHRNKIIHGATKEESAQLLLDNLKEAVSQHFHTFSANPRLCATTACIPFYLQTLTAIIKLFF